MSHGFRFDPIAPPRAAETLCHEVRTLRTDGNAAGFKPCLTRHGTHEADDPEFDREHPFGIIVRALGRH